MGVRAGVPDVLFPVARGPYNGLALEFKSARGSLSQAQRDWANALQAQGWRVEIVRSGEAAWAVARDYYRLGARAAA